MRVASGIKSSTEAPAAERPQGKPIDLMFMYLGRRGALGRFTLELAQCAAKLEGLRSRIVVSRSGEQTEEIKRTGANVLELPTFGGRNPVTLVRNFLSARNTLISEIERQKPAAVITLMPHIWNPLLTRAIKRRGVLYASIAHDVVAHPGDGTAAMLPWLLRDAKQADLTLTLSRAVADRLVTRGIVKAEQTCTLFHPDLSFGSELANRRRDPNRPFRLLFFGRIMTYKGLPLLIEAVRILRAEGVPVVLGVAGAGGLDDAKDRLGEIDAEIVNRWLEDNEIGGLLARYDAVVCSHIEASQSGVAATAFGNLIPVIATPVGALVEQVVDGKTGVLAKSVSARSLAAAIRRLIEEPHLYERITSNLTATVEDRSMARFVRELVSNVISALRP